MMQSLVLYYAETGDYKSALQTQYKVNDAIDIYNNINRGGQLNILEKELLQKRKNLEIDYEKKIGYFLIFLIITLIAFVFVLIKLHFAKQQKNRLMQRENSLMRVELEQLTKELDSHGGKNYIFRIIMLPKDRLKLSISSKKEKPIKKLEPFYSFPKIR